jgi:IclR family acetate operon transcriptional repressor
MTGAKEEPSSANYQVRALERALDILDAFSLAEPTLTLTALASRAGLAKSTATRLLAVLEERGWLERSAETERYRIGVRAFEVGSVYIQTTTLEVEAQPFLRALAEGCRQTASLAIMRRDEVVHIAVLAPDRPIRFTTPIGQREPAHATGLGKALLTALSDDELIALVSRGGMTARTARTVTSLADLRVQLVAARERGYAVDEEESYDGLSCVAAPVSDVRGETIAAIGVSGLAAEFNGVSLPEYSARVRDAALGLSERLGFRVRAAIADI